MKKWVLALAVLVAFAVVGFMAMRMLAPPPPDLDLARSKPSVNGLYVIEIGPEVEPIQQGPLHSWIVSVTTPEGVPVTDAGLSIDGGMPQHGHGLPTAPQATGHLGEGRYRIEGVRFNMGGWWTLAIGVSAPAGEDTAVFNIVL